MNIPGEGTTPPPVDPLAPVPDNGGQTSEDNGGDPNRQQQQQQQQQTPATQTPPTDRREGDLNFKIPEEYAKEPWAQNIKDPNTLWKEMANAQSLIGKKGIIPPGENATPEEIRQFYTKQGCPENPEGYEFKNLEDLKDKQRNSEIDNGVKQILHELGISKEKGEQLVSKMEALVYERAKPTLEAKAKQEADWAELKRKTFGDAQDVATNNFKTIMAETLGDKYQHLAAKMNELPNDALAVLMVYGKAMHDTYVGETKIAPGGGQEHGSDLKTQFQELSKQKLAVKSDPHMTKHVRDQKLQEINRRMMEVGQKAHEQGINVFV